MITYAFVFARSGSKGLPKKNILPLNGIPLFAHSIKTAIEIDSVSKIFVSTESEVICSLAKSFGAIPIKRPKSLALDSTPEYICWQHAITQVKSIYGEFDRFLSLPPTSPLRRTSDVVRALDALRLFLLK